MSARDRRLAVIVAGHRGDTTVPSTHLDDPDASVRGASLHALERSGTLADHRIVAAFGDPAPEVRRQAAELAGRRPTIDLGPLLGDGDATVVEIAAWACGEQEHVTEATLDRLIELATDADEPLVREAAAAALGAIGDERGLPAILAACADKPHVRRRAVLALAPFEGPEVDAAIERAAADRDWQVRQAADDLRRAIGEVELGGADSGAPDGQIE
jgi:HEAT repeat protein